jgi:hypothetical protein
MTYRVAECRCRLWQVVLGHPLRRCGHCHERPVLVSPEKKVTW